MKYASFDATGKITGFYSEDIHGEAGSAACKIPMGAIQITDVEWQDCINNPGKWMVDVQTKALVLAPPPAPPTAAELLLSIRSQRDSLLAICDWTQLPDSPLAADKKAVWATYRQALRDFPATCDPANPAWPVPPAA